MQNIQPKDLRKHKGKYTNKIEILKMFNHNKNVTITAITITNDIIISPLLKRTTKPQQIIILLWTFEVNSDSNYKCV